MFDLIYYNPIDGSRMSGASATPSRAGSSRASTTSGTLPAQEDDAVVPDRLRAVRERLQEEAADEPGKAASITDEQNQSSPPSPARGVAGSSEEEEADSAEGGETVLPVPQVKVGPNGEMILDEESTVIETTASKKAKADLLRSPLVFENAVNGANTNYGSWGKKRKNVDWSDRETLKFYKALSVFGTDFSMMELISPFHTTFCCLGTQNIRMHTQSHIIIHVGAHTHNLSTCWESC